MSPTAGRRLAGIAFVLILHIAIVSVFLRIATDTLPQATPQAAEITLLLPPPLPPSGKPKPHDARTASRTASATAAMPDYRGITVTEAPPAPDGLNRSLFGCADIDKLSPEERRRCAGALITPDDGVDFRDHVDRSRLAALWERGRVRKNGPLLLPCMNPNAPPAISLAVIACLAKGAVEGGFDPNTQPSYADTPQITHLPNNGDPPDHPTGF